MRKNLLSWVIFAALLVVPFGAVAAEDSSDLLLESGRILDPASKTMTSASILIRGGRIEAYLDRKPKHFSGKAVDLAGRYVLPGFLDMHVHSYGNASPSGMPEILRTEGSALRALAAGVTGFLDLSAFEDQILELRDRRRVEGGPGADIYSAGTALTCPGGHGTQFPNPARLVSSPAQARQAVADLAAKHPDAIKLIYIPSHPRLPSIDRPTMEAIVEAAALHSIPSIAHINYWNDALEVVRAGVSAITHTSYLPPPTALLDEMQRRGTSAIPTLAVHTELSWILDQPSFLDGDLIKAVAHPDLLEIYRQDRASFPPKIRQWIGRQKERRQGYLDAVKSMARKGIPILTGTDAGNPGAFQGYSVHREMWLLVEAGLSPWQALAAATTRPARFLGLRAGVHPGDRADLVVLSESPLEDIRNTEKIWMVIHHGRIIDREAFKVEAK